MIDYLGVEPGEEISSKLRGKQLASSQVEQGMKKLKCYNQHTTATSATHEMAMEFSVVL